MCFWEKFTSVNLFCENDIMSYYHYEQRPSLSLGFPLRGSVKFLIVANAVIFVFQFFANLAHQELASILGLRPWFVIYYHYFWQLLTYMFLHGNVFHLLLNMLMLWMFGSEIEYHFGTRRFLIYYFLCGIGAGVVTTVVLPFTSLPLDIPIIGASGAIYGLLLAYGVLFPNRIVLLMFLFPMKVKYVVIIFAAIEFFSSVNQAQDGISHFTHLGGMIFGGAYLLLIYRGYNLRKIWQKIKFERAKRKVTRYDSNDHDQNFFH